MRFFYVIGWALLPLSAGAQVRVLEPDTLSEVLITAFGKQRKSNVAAAITVLQPAEFASFSPVSVLPAVNTIPGVRMEERSPGSYRLGIRGSALQAPFGVRNVKVYYNDIPLTDPGGTTYLNALGTSNFGSVEVVRGPGNSLYGSGTGGAVLLRGPASIPGPKAEIGIIGGSYGLFKSNAGIRLGDSLKPVVVSWEHLQSNGYREQSGIRRNVFTSEGVLAKSIKGDLSFTALYSDLEYETPGALTRNEFETDPKSARPAAGSSPGAAAAGAKIAQQLALIGLTGNHQIGKYLTGKATLYASTFTQENPNIRNYSFLNAPHFGGRASVQYSRWWGPHNLQILAGGEAQQGTGSATVFSNKGGSPDALQSVQSSSYRNGILFAQVQYRIHKWTFTAAGSGNRSNLKLVSGLSGGAFSGERATRNYNDFAPRFSILRRLSRSTSIYAAASKGFSAPPLDAVAPTGSPLNTGLGAQQGWTYETGYKQSAFNSRVTVEVTAFYGALQDLIVVRRDANGGDTYVNAGSTNQSGIEAALQYNWGNNLGYWGSFKTAYTGAFFRYNNFLNSIGDYSGNQYPGVAPNTVSAVATFCRQMRWSVAGTYFYSDSYWANDANTAGIGAYQILGIKADYRFFVKQQIITLTAGADNLLDQRYTLGPDLNAFGGRTYNGAPSRNGYIGLKWSWNK